MSNESVEVKHNASGVSPLQASSWKHLAARHGTPLLVLDMAQVRLQYKRLTSALPGVQMFYAVKALPYPAVISTLAEL